LAREYNPFRERIPRRPKAALGGTVQNGC
jgi:hypothetical protein